MDSRTLLARAVVKLILQPDDTESESGIQTAWFFTDQGHLLTVGHGFREIEATVGQQFGLRHISGWQGEATLLEFEPGEDIHLDYAILQLAGPMSDELTHIPISKTIYHRYHAFPQSIIGYGFAAGLDGRSIVLKGSWESFSSLTNPATKRRQQINTSGEEALGLSGSPICLGENTPEFGAMGIQMGQGNASGAHYIYFSQPLSDVFSSSPRLKHLIRQQDDRTASLKWPLYKLEEAFLIKEISRVHDFRGIWSVRPTNATPVGGEIIDLLNNEKNALIDKLTQTIASFDWLDPKRRKKPINPRFDTYAWNMQHGSPPLGLFVDSGHTFRPDEDVPYIRLVHDFTGTLDFKPAKPYKRSPRSSHFVGVKYFADTTQWDASSHQNVDLVLEVARTTPEQTARVAAHLVEDLLLDLNIFHAIPCLLHFFPEGDGMRAFSSAKIAFARERQLKLDGLPIPSAKFGYLSLAGCCRKSLTSEIDLRQLAHLWTDFLKDFLFPSLSLRTNGSTPALTDEQAVALFCRAQTFGRQVSPRALQWRLDQLKTQPGELCILAKIISLPSNKKDRIALQHLFRPGSRLSKRVGAFYSHQLHLLCQFKPHVKFMLFRRVRTL